MLFGCFRLLIKLLASRSMVPSLNMLLFVLLTMIVKLLYVEKCWRSKSLVNGLTWTNWRVNIGKLTQCIAKTDWRITSDGYELETGSFPLHGIIVNFIKSSVIQVNLRSVSFLESVWFYIMPHRWFILYKVYTYLWM